MIAATKLIDARCAPELAPHDDAHILVQTALVQVSDKGGQTVVIERQERAVGFEEGWQAVCAVMIPQSHLQRDEGHARLDEAPRPHERFPVPGNRTGGM